MADKKISALAAAATPLDGSEVLPIVQSGSTVKVSVANLTFGRAITATNGTFVGNIELTNGADRVVQIGSSTNYNYKLKSVGDDFQIIDGSNNTRLAIAYSTANVTVGQGNLVMGTAGKGIDFSANGGDVLSQYDEGTWTPVITGSSSNPTVTYDLQRGKYVRVGNVVTVSAFIGWSAISGGSGDLRISLPFAGESSVGASGAGSISSMDGFTFAAGRTFCSFQPQANVLYGNLPQTGSGVSSSNTTIAQMASSGLIIFSCTYLI